MGFEASLSDILTKIKEQFSHIVNPDCLCREFSTNVTIAKTLYEKYLVYFGWPDKIIMDQGWNFESKLITELCSLAQVKKLCTTPYRPEGNGQCERFNSTLINMISTLPSG